MSIKLFLYLFAILFIKTEEENTVSKEYKIGSGSEFIVLGSSNVRRWKVVSKMAEGKAFIKIENDRISRIENLSVSIPAESLLSGKKSMDVHTYEALKTKQYPTIFYLLDKINNIENENGYQLLSATGYLNIAGISKHINLKVKSHLLNEIVFFEGEIRLLMNEFNVTPPTALAGTLRTRNDIIIVYKVSFQPLK